MTNSSYLRQFEANLAYYFSEVLNYPFAKPCWVYVSLSHKCTYSCKMCGVVKILKGQELPQSTVNAALENIAGWGWDTVVTLTGGEPFLRRDIFSIIDHAVMNKVKIEIVSNGSLIDKALAKRIVNSGLKNIAISLDGATEFTHDFIREKGSFNNALKAISNLVDAKRQIGSGPQISVWTTIMKENVSELFNIIDIVKELGVECLVYHPVIVAQNDMQNTSADAPFWITGSGIDKLKEQIGKIVGYQMANGLVVFLHDPYLWVDYFKGSLSCDMWKCNPFVFINIGPDGEVRSCGSSFGNIAEAGLDFCLHTEEADKARALMKICQKPCLQTCWANPESDSLGKIISTFFSKMDADSGCNKSKIIKKAIKALQEYRKIIENYA